MLCTILMVNCMAPAVYAEEEPTEIVITPENFFDYFNPSFYYSSFDGNTLSGNVAEGSTLIFQGQFLTSDTTNYSMKINKRVNIT